ncbi:hypothetical protein EI94DRAFT_1783500 [Lactarius quietus]|nr:hypothetical protein EI94DRAFT_1783500 [Lactarius quietus]
MAYSLFLVLRIWWCSAFSFATVTAPNVDGDAPSTNSGTSLVLAQSRYYSRRVTNGGNPEGLFRAAFMQSGSPTPIGDITHGQLYYDFLIENINCSGSSDTLASTGNSLPYVEGRHRQHSSIFSYHNTRRTEAELRTYITEFFVSNAKDGQVDELLNLYPQNVTRGSPYDTGPQNALMPEFKCIASVLGDLVTLRVHASKHTSTLSHTVSKRMKSLPILGSTHGSDLLNIYGEGDLTDFLIHFATNLDPNCGLSPEWPRYTRSSQLMTFLDGYLKVLVSDGDYMSMFGDQGVCGGSGMRPLQIFGKKAMTANGTWTRPIVSTSQQENFPYFVQDSRVPMSPARSSTVQQAWE